jgi:hypothetical protein
MMTVATAYVTFLKQSKGWSLRTLCSGTRAAVNPFLYASSLNLETPQKSVTNLNPRLHYVGFSIWSFLGAGCDEDERIYH